MLRHGRKGSDSVWSLFSLHSAIAGLQDGLKELLNETRVRWIPPESIHFPLQLYTDLDVAHLPTFRAKLEALAAATRPFEVSLKGLSVVSSWRKPRKVRSRSGCAVCVVCRR